MKIKIPFKEICTLFISLLVFMLIGEALIRVYLKRHIIYDIEMSTYAARAKIESSNPKIGHEHKPGANVRLMGVNVNINSDGLRDDEYTYHHKGRKRIILLGDSLTFGWGVEKDKTFENILEQRFNSIEPTDIINFGIGNYNTEQEVNLFKEKALKYGPDAVVVFYFINDAEITPKRSRWWFLGYSKIITFYWSKVNAFKNNIFKSEGFENYYKDLYKPGSEGWENSKKAFIELRDLCISKGIDLKVVILPELHNLKKYPFKTEHDKITRFLSGIGIKNIDLAKYFEWCENPMELWVATDDAHPNGKAHRMIADYCYDFIASN